jgi:hypothetical protein
VDEIYKADKKVGYTQEYQIVIIDEITAVPGQDKDTKSDNNTEYLGKAVEKKIAVKTGQV